VGSWHYDARRLDGRIDPYKSPKRVIASIP
jgi:hypothetical protein